METKPAGLGYRCVSSADYKQRLGYDYLEFRIMSDKQNPHYMEHKINEFLTDLRQTKFSKFTNDFDLVKNHLIQRLGDPNPSVQVDSRDHWRQILDSKTSPDFAAIRQQRLKTLMPTTLADIEN